MGTKGRENTLEGKKRHRLTRLEEERIFLEIAQLGGYGLCLARIQIVLGHKLGVSPAQVLRLYSKGLVLGVLQPLAPGDVLPAKSLPPSLRKALGLAPDDLVAVAFSDGEVSLRKYA